MSYLKVGFLAGVGGNRTGIGDYFRKVAEGRSADYRHELRRFRHYH